MIPARRYDTHHGFQPAVGRRTRDFNTRAKTLLEATFPVCARTWSSRSGKTSSERKTARCSATASRASRAPRSSSRPAETLSRRLENGCGRRGWPVVLEASHRKRLRRRGTVCGVAAPLRCAPASPSSRLLASSPAALATPLHAIFQQPASPTASDRKAIFPTSGEMSLCPSLIGSHDDRRGWKQVIGPAEGHRSSCIRPSPGRRGPSRMKALQSRTRSP